MWLLLFNLWQLSCQKRGQTWGSWTENAKGSLTERSDLTSEQFVCSLSNSDQVFQMAFFLHLLPQTCLRVESMSCLPIAPPPRHTHTNESNKLCRICQHCQLSVELRQAGPKFEQQNYTSDNSSRLTGLAVIQPIFLIV